MKALQTKLTSKNQTSVPQSVRNVLKVKSGEEIEWQVVKGIVVVGKTRKVKNPVKFLTSQIKLDLDAVELVKKAREDFS